MAHIDYFFTVLSPYVYLAGTRLEAIAARHGATITYKPVDAGAVFARTGGVALADRHPSRKEYRAQELPRQVRKLGVDFNLQPAHWPVNPAPASYAVIADKGLLAGAETYAANLEEAVSRGVFGAPFYLVDSGQRFWGQDRLEDLDAHLSGKL
jgi:2-hydroxychromene-2-carboxylate isomerase